jgi:hypothetical protein
MKLTKLLPILLLALVVVTSSCQKEENESALGDPKGSESKPMNDTYISKSTPSDFELMALAANLKEIDYSAGSYYVSFYGTTSVYEVEIVSFDSESVIEYDVTLGSTTTKVTIDAEDEEITIQGSGVISFEDFGKETVTPSMSFMQRIAGLVTTHHLIDPLGFISFSDNGNSDFFPVETDPEARACFWCTRVTRGPCQFNFQMETTTTTIFWGVFEHVHQEPVPCE